MGATASSQSDSDFPAFDQVQEGDEAFEEVAKLLQERCKPYVDHYGRSLKLKKLWRLRPSEKLQKMEANAKALGKPTQLFHGTSVEKAMAIAKDGFKVPTSGNSNMFGRGVYFADCPLKSANYAPDGSVFTFSRIVKDGFLDAFKKKHGQLLLCDVYLGRSKTLRRAANKFNPDSDLKPSWFTEKLQNIGLLESGDYNSVHVPGGFFGAVNVTEYVVYQEHQGIPKYFIEFDYVPESRSK